MLTLLREPTGSSIVGQLAAESLALQLIARLFFVDTRSRDPIRVAIESAEIQTRGNTVGLACQDLPIAGPSSLLDACFSGDRARFFSRILQRLEQVIQATRDRVDHTEHLQPKASS